MLCTPSIVEDLEELEPENIQARFFFNFSQTSSLSRFTRFDAATGQGVVVASFFNAVNEENILAVKN